MQVSLDGDPARGGATGDTVLDLADEIAGRPQLRLRGVMAVAPLGADPDRAFGDLAEVSARVRATHPQASAISAGMSADLEAAIDTDPHTCVSERRCSAVGARFSASVAATSIFSAVT